GLFVKTDVSDEGQVKALMDKAAEKTGRIDIVINPDISLEIQGSGESLVFSGDFGVVFMVSPPNALH
ncbi:MAG: hypothetical protein ACE5OR_17465, partial [bacterium]